MLQAEKAAPPAVSPDSSKRVKKSKKAKRVEVRAVNTIAVCMQPNPEPITNPDCIVKVESAVNVIAALPSQVAPPPPPPPEDSSSSSESEVEVEPPLKKGKATPSKPTPTTKSKQKVAKKTEPLQEGSSSDEDDSEKEGCSSDEEDSDEEGKAGLGKRSKTTPTAAPPTKSGQNVVEEMDPVQDGSSSDEEGSEEEGSSSYEEESEEEEKAGLGKRSKTTPTAAPPTKMIKNGIDAEEEGRPFCLPCTSTVAFKHTQTHTQAAPSLLATSPTAVAKTTYTHSSPHRASIPPA